MNDQIDQGESADSVFIPENPSNDTDMEAPDGSTIRHRLVYVRDRPDLQDGDFRIHALQQANIAFNNSRYRFSEPLKASEEDVTAEKVAGMASVFYDFLKGETA